MEGRRLFPRTTACGSDEIWGQVKPFAGLVRNDTFGHPVVILPGSVYVTAGTDRRTSGTHYTPRTLTEPIVQYTLEPLAYLGPAEGKPKEEWRLRSPKEILDLKVCDMACGSGAFLVQACRYLSERLVEAWEGIEAQNPGKPGLTLDGETSTGAVEEMLIPEGTAERKTLTILTFPLGPVLRKSLRSTNPIESTLSSVRRVCRNVKRWRGGAMVYRWTVMGLKEAERGFCRLKGKKDMAVLVNALRARDLDEKRKVA